MKRLLYAYLFLNTVAGFMAFVPRQNDQMDAEPKKQARITKTEKPRQYPHHHQADKVL